MASPATPILVNGGFDVPNALVNPAWKGWSAEQIYAALLEEVEKQKQKPKTMHQRTTQRTVREKQKPKQGKAPM